MLLGGTCCTAAAVASGSSSQQNHDITVDGTFPPHILCRSRSDDSTYFHSFGNISGMIDFIDLSGCKTDLVSVGTVAVSGRRNQLTLGKLSRKSLGNRSEGICRAGDAHRRIDITSSRKGVADRAADAGGRAAERLDFRRMIVGLVLEEKQPFFRTPFCFHIDFDGTGVDFFRFVKFIHHAA